MTCLDFISLIRLDSRLSVICLRPKEALIRLAAHSITQPVTEGPKNPVAAPAQSVLICDHLWTTKAHKTSAVLLTLALDFRKPFGGIFVTGPDHGREEQNP